MIKIEELERCDKKLFVYDVTQHGWEQEHNGFKANVQHTLTHLAKDAFRKDFTDYNMVQYAIAPDNLMYALRLARWGKVQPKQIISSETSSQIAVDRMPKYFANTPESLVPHLVAIDTVADLIHEEDHRSSHEHALGDRFNKVMYASRLLLMSVSKQVNEFDFNIEDSFDNRLFELRKRFNIPQPE